MQTNIPSWEEKTINEFYMKCMNEVKKDDKNNKIKTLYHYTNLRNLKLILSDRNFLFSDFRYLNDSLELHYGLDLINNIMIKLKFKHREKFLNKLRSLIDNPRNLNFYISCFSETPTNLSLWRYYGDDGFGVAIGVDNNFNLESDQPDCGRVKYGDRSFGASLSKLIKRINKITTCSKFKYLTQSNQESMESNLHAELANFIIIQSILTKHPSFKEEEEIRLFLMDGKYSRKAMYPKGFFYPIERIKSYSSESDHWNIKEDLSICPTTSVKEKRSLVSSSLKIENFKEIWLGSKCNSQVKKNIKELITSLGYDLSKIKIEQVDLPYK